MKMMKHVSALLATAVLGLSLQGCIFVAGAAVGAAAAGAVVFDKRSAKQTDQDKAITEQIENLLNDNADIENSAHIVVVTFNGVVLLAGDVPDAAMQTQVATIAKTVPGIKKLYNQVVISGKPSTLSRMNDSYISAKLKTKMMADDELQSSQIEVVTVVGTVFLMGTVTQDQAQIATDIAQHVSGVVKVVRVFQYN